jgi:hypothetical protein
MRDTNESKDTGVRMHERDTDLMSSMGKLLEVEIRVTLVPLRLDNYRLILVRELPRLGSILVRLAQSKGDTSQNHFRGTARSLAVQMLLLLISR